MAEKRTREQPVYVVGDTICLRLRTSHSVNLGGVRAVFRRLPERREELRDPYITLQDEHYLLSQAGPIRASEVYFEAESSSRWGMRSVFGSPRNLACPPGRLRAGCSTC